MAIAGDSVMADYSPPPSTIMSCTVKASALRRCALRRCALGGSVNSSARISRAVGLMAIG